MRTKLTVLALATALPLAAQTAKPTTRTVPHTTRTVPHTTRSHSTTAGAKKVSTEPTIPGLAAIGDMPAVTGKPESLYALQYVDLVVGTGELAQTHKWYTVHYTGWTLDGKKFDSSHDHEGGQPFVFPAGAHRVIMGWDTGFEGMRIGGKRRLIVPYQLAYGEAGHPPVIPEKATLVFDVEFLGQSDQMPAPPAPPAASESKPASDSSKPADSTQK